MARITFTCASPAASFAPSVNPSYAPGYIRTKLYHQPKRLSDDGSVYSYNKGESGKRTIGFTKLPAADLASEIAFFDAIGGSSHTFTFKDRDDATYTARKAGDSLTWREVEPGFYDVSVDLEIT